MRHPWENVDFIWYKTDIQVGNINIVLYDVDILLP